MIVEPIPISILHSSLMPCRSVHQCMYVRHCHGNPGGDKWQDDKKSRDAKFLERLGEKQHDNDSQSVSRKTQKTKAIGYPNKDPPSPSPAMYHVLKGRFCRVRKHNSSNLELRLIISQERSKVSQVQVLWLKNQLVRLLPPLLSAPPSWLCTLLACKPAKDGTPAPSPGVLALGPPPPRRGLAMRPKGLLAKLGWEGAAPPRPRVEPCLAASRRSLTARSWDSNLENVG